MFAKYVMAKTMKYLNLSIVSKYETSQNMKQHILWNVPIYEISLSKKGHKYNDETLPDMNYYKLGNVTKCEISQIIIVTNYEMSHNMKCHKGKGSQNMKHKYIWKAT